MRALAIGLALLMLAPLVASDHVYSHRFVIDGRLVGSDGAPLPGREVEVVASGVDLLEPCREGPHQSVTDQWGDFRFCYHHHEMAPDVRVVARSGNASAERPADVAMRRMSFLLTEPNETGIAPEAWETSYRITGRVWRPGPQQLEGVQVFGVAVIGIDVNLTVRADDGSETPFHTRTDAYGDFDLAIETNAAPSNVSLTIEANGRPQPTQLDAFSHRTHIPLYVSAVPPEEGARGAPSDEPIAYPQQPGSVTPRVNPVLIVGTGLALVAAIVLSRRKS